MLSDSSTVGQRGAILIPANKSIELQGLFLVRRVAACYAFVHGGLQE